MKIFSKCWWVFGIIEVAATLLNPYIGIFGIFNVVELFCITIAYGYIISVLKTMIRYGENGFAKAGIKATCIMLYIVSVIFFFLKLLAGGLVFIVASSRHEIFVPYQIWSTPDTMGVVCLIVEMIFNVLLLISFIYRIKSLKKKAN
ncbi:hypothetical protein [Inconstantimicrobium mannanitabidum]|uniref:Uncharacterized protein n=1 Tax=Inconstantimicrobium mannanitabidum TaxID=1604901 RepID=A0ACB5RER1_9CLOT|nr:hypothetical protein [Clostridium sp. TW13]GKX67543.1 hypothetical protein rsdtw13_28010 [Clostridium sp. TW13]